MVPFVDPLTGVPLEQRDDALWAPGIAEPAARVVDGVPRFVARDENYAESFGWQWKHWANTLSDRRSASSAKRQEVLQRTHFLEYDLRGKTILECGMGGGDDTEVLLDLPFAEVHSFDLSTAVDRAVENLDDPRLVVSQASITAIPYADEAFDFVFCHRVLQHTPDPVASLRSICRKVKPGGILFAHVYKRGWRNQMHFKYKYRWLTRRLPSLWVAWYVERFGPTLHALNRFMWRRNVLLKGLAYNFVPFQYRDAYGDMTDKQLLELAKLNTFDALTPRYDRPLTSLRFRTAIEAEGFRIEHYHDPSFSPLLCTAVKTRASSALASAA